MRDRRRARESRQGNLYLFTGLIVGLVLGLLFAYVISPVQYTDTEPGSLSTNYKDEYRRVIALAYAADHDLGRARERLNLLSPDAPSQVLASQAQRMKAENQPSEDVRALALLASDLLKPPAEVAAISTGAVEQSPMPTEIDLTATPESSPTATLDTGAAIQTPTIPQPTRTPVVTRTPQPTFTPRPSATPQPVINALFTLESRKELCDGSVPAGLMQIEVADSKGKPFPGVHITVTWKDGQDNFYTGLSPEINPGYADFTMTAGQTYILRVGEVSKTVDDLKSNPNCGWKLKFTEQGAAQN